MSFRRILLVLPALVLIAGIALTVRTPGRKARWLAEYEQTKHYLATADANFDWVVRKRGIDLAALDAQTKREVEGAWTSLGAAWAVRGFVWKFRDGHTWARIRPGIWWNGLTGGSATEPAGGAATGGAATGDSATGDPALTPQPTLLASMDAAAACAVAGIDVAARPDGWELPFDQLPGAEPLPDEEFPAVLLPIAGGRKVGILRVANFGHERYGPACERAWAAFRPQLSRPCDGECHWALTAAAMKDGAARAADVARELARRGAVAVVVDVSGNGGGSELADAMARALTPIPLHLAPGGFIRHPLHVTALTDVRQAIATDTARATAAQRAILLPALARVDTLLVEARRDCGRDVVWSGGASACSNTVATTPLVSYAALGTFDGLENGWAVWGPAWHAGAEGRYDGPLLILQDHASASASEEFAARLRDNGAARIIGERSFGAGCGYSSGGTRLELPALGLLIRAPDCQRLRMDGTNETEGIAADVDAGWTETDNAKVRAEKAARAIATALAR